MGNTRLHYPLPSDRSWAVKHGKITNPLANYSYLRILGDTMVVHMRHTSGHTRNRRSHHALKVARFETCKDCNAKHLMHRACATCGKYRGRVVVDVLKKTKQSPAKTEAKQKPASEKKPAKAKKEAKEKKPKEKKEKKSA